LSIKMKTSDPAYFMLDNPAIPRTPIKVYSPDCYICRDDEYARMGLPLCYRCTECDGHVAADDTVCDDCGYDCDPYVQDHYEREVDEVGLSEMLGAVMDALDLEVDDEILQQELREQFIESGGFYV
jgi:hypothetical protein